MDNDISNIEKKLEDVYIPIFEPIFGLAKAKEIVKNYINKAKDDAKKSGKNWEPENYGDYILQNYQKDETLKKYVEMIKAEGVKNDDIRNWWNLHFLEREMSRITDDHFRLTLFLEGMNKSGNSDEAAKDCRKYFPYYGDSKDTTHTIGDDRLLPYELKDRVNLYIEQRIKTDPLMYKQNIEESSTFNALIRREIRSGKV